MSQTDNIYQMITIASSILKYICTLKRDLGQGEFDHINQLITLLMITLRGFDCIFILSNILTDKAL